MKSLIFRFLLIVPWVFLVWLIGQGISGEIGLLLVFVLLFILIPGAVVLNLITAVAFKGHETMQVIRQMQQKRDIGNQKLESENYSELPWWHPKKYL